MSLDTNHPPVKKNKIGVLLLNLGTPDATDYWSMRRYLSEFLSDKRVIDYSSWLWQPLLQGIILTRRPFKSGHAYEQIWNKDLNESPIRTFTRTQCEMITERLQKAHPDTELVIDWAMRYGNPSTKNVLDRMVKEDGCTKILLFALYPQYSACTTASAYDKAFDALKLMPYQPAIRTAQAWHDDPDYIHLLKNSVEGHLKEQQAKPDHIIASFHGVPKRYLMQGDPYSCFCHKTGRLLREALNWPEAQWTNSFQSRFGPEEWIQPYTEDTVIQLAQDGIKHLAILSPAFVSDCVETLEEINIGLRELFLEHGGERFTYIPCLNDHSDHIDFLAGRISSDLCGWLK